MLTCARMMVLSLTLGAAVAARAGDSYYEIPVRELKFVDGGLPVASKEADSQDTERILAMRPYAWLEGSGEIYVEGRSLQGDTWYSVYDPSVAVSTTRNGPGEAGTRVFVRTPEAREVTGRLYVPKPDLSGMMELKFTIPASSASADAKVDFQNVKIAYYDNLQGRDLPGTAWFRHQARMARFEAGQQTANGNGPAARTPVNNSELAESFELFTGGRALSENLQLDRSLPTTGANEKPVKIDTLKGVDIAEIDWKPLIKDAHPKLDPLASKIPGDQYAVFFPTFLAALAMADETKKHDTPVLRLAQPRSSDTHVVDRYQRQLGISPTEIARLLGPKVAKSIAVTGSDPYFPTGTDVAVILESPQPSMLSNLISVRISFAAAQNKAAHAVRGEINGLAYHGFVSPDRSMSSYIAELEGAVVVTNSTFQLGRIADAHNGKSKSIADLPEFKFFRTRYPLGDADETGLVFLSDSTIRRWCGPRWRIADSRRTRARGVLAELQASQADALVTKKVVAGPIHTDLPVLGGGQIDLAASGVVSSVYGTIDFMTPISEIPLDEVSEAEATAYRLWRDGYQRNWSWGFDPIALRIGLGKNKVAADLSVMPLIFSTEYREFLSIAQGGHFDPTAGDPHSALLHFILAINRESSSAREAENFISMMSQGISLGWLGRYVSAYADDDPFWEELAKVDEKHVEKFMEDNLGRLPVAVRIDVSNSFKLAAFLTAARAFIEQTSPGLTHWESKKYHDQPYVCISQAKGQPGVPPELQNLAIYYSAVGGALTITPSEKVMERSLDRASSRAAEPDKTATTKHNVRSWLGSTVGLSVESKILELGNTFGRRTFEDAAQRQSWNNLPILNEWKRLYPDRDPVKVQLELWGEEPVCPGGGKYVWDAKRHSMASTVYGDPAEPKKGPPAPPVLSTFSAAHFGLTLEDHGLRARVELPRAK